MSPQRVVDPAYTPFTITTPKGTAIAAPQSTALNVPVGQLLEVELQIPPGHHGTTGFRLQLAGSAILPFSNPPAWILGDNYQRVFALDVEVGGGLVAVTYNVGNYDHTHYLRALVRSRLTQPTRQRVQLLDLNGASLS